MHTGSHINFLNLGESVNEQNFQNGLMPGSVIGLQGNSGGHSAIFIKYTEDGKGRVEWGHTGPYWRNFNDSGVYGKQLIRATNFR